MKTEELKDRISILALKSTITGTDTVYTWSKFISIWSKAEKLEKTNIFSSVGLGVKSIKFTIRKRNLTLHNAFSWKGLHCFLTDIVEINRRYYEVMAALIEPKTCTVSHTTTIKGDLNRPVEISSGTLTFPGCLTEKHLGFSRGEPMAEQELRYVLITPKAIDLRSGQVVTVEGVPYEVLLEHTLDEYKNEYEIERRLNP